MRTSIEQTRSSGNSAIVCRTGKISALRLLEDSGSGNCSGDELCFGALLRGFDRVMKAESLR